jgi:protein-S-isoprenylcysteine O-methyltransferase Ste14
MPRQPGDRWFWWAIDPRTAMRWAKRAPLLVFLYSLLIIGALLGVFVARGYPPVLAVVVGLILAGGAALGAYLARKTVGKMGL